VAKKILALIPQKELQNNIICVYLRNLREIKNSGEVGEWLNGLIGSALWLGARERPPMLE